MGENPRCGRIETPFGSLAVQWSVREGKAGIDRICLPQAAAGGAAEAGSDPDGAIPPPVADLLARLAAFAAGEAVRFPLESLRLANCSPFQRRVLLAQAAVPRGKVTTYGLLAEHLGQPRAVRAVGTALARNPFPIVIPCHRTVRSDGTLGGYAGGLAMKRALLAAEGILFAEARGGKPRVERRCIVPPILP
jgi:methylated-DNA-[protein]-cysteine S-methyltransferase